MGRRLLFPRRLPQVAQQGAAHEDERGRILLSQRASRGGSAVSGDEDADHGHPPPSNHGREPPQKKDTGLPHPNDPEKS
jgi:hypothetical protein